MLRLCFLLLAVLCCAPRAGAQNEPRHGPPARLLRPAPIVPNSRAVFAPSLVEGLRLSALTVALDDLSQRERKRFWPGALALGFGVGFGVGAIFVKDSGLRTALSLGALVSSARGTLQLATRTGAGDAQGAFAIQGADSKRALYQKLRSGELGLAQVARVARRERIGAGCITVFGSAAYLPLQWAFARLEGSGHRFGSVAGDYVGLSLSLIALASGLVQAIMMSPAERYYADYRALRSATARLRREPR